MNHLWKSQISYDFNHNIDFFYIVSSNDKSNFQINFNNLIILAKNTLNVNKIFFVHLITEKISSNNNKKSSNIHYMLRKIAELKRKAKLIYYLISLLQVFIGQII